ncbi:transmembrane protein 179-like [Stegostoma tigrinum]|uniref:transmembrane protein 179-like n=1 Tax=Stegostoma tigrinum TaxID=3053191 RepID=UPI00286FF31B|nr:transmembrane protein 179-like [Stegostoma tigrinum]
MEISNKLLSAQCCSYLLALLFSLFVVVPLAENGREFKGRCLLFSRAFWREENSTGSLINRFVVEEWGPSAACQFCTFVGFFTLIFCAVQAWRTLFYLCKGHDDTFFSAFLNLLLSCSVLFLTIVACVMISVGFNIWCDVVTNHGSMPMRLQKDLSQYLLESNRSYFLRRGNLTQVAIISVLSKLSTCSNSIYQHSVRSLIGSSPSETDPGSFLNEVKGFCLKHRTER